MIAKKQFIIKNLMFKVKSKFLALKINQQITKIFSCKIKAWKNNLVNKILMNNNKVRYKNKNNKKFSNYNNNILWDKIHHN